MKYLDFFGTLAPITCMGNRGKGDPGEKDLASSKYDLAKGSLSGTYITSVGATRHWPCHSNLLVKALIHTEDKFHFDFDRTEIPPLNQNSQKKENDTFVPFAIEKLIIQ